MFLLPFAAIFRESLRLLVRFLTVFIDFLSPAILTAAMEMLGGQNVGSSCRKPEIMADAAYAVLLRDVSCTGQFLIDEDVLKKEGITDLDQYAVEPGALVHFFY